jgi:hypothetical protein
MCKFLINLLAISFEQKFSFCFLASRDHHSFDR